MPVYTSIKAGLKYAEADYVSIAERGRFDVKPKEDQIKCALYRSFREAGFLVHVEAGYQRKAGRCDLFAACGSGKSTVAIEIKTAWAGTGWTNKPAQQRRSWEVDIDKIQALAGGDWANCGYFILCLAYEKGSTSELRLRDEVSTLGGSCCLHSSWLTGTVSMKHSFVWSRSSEIERGCMAKTRACL